MPPAVDLAVVVLLSAQGRDGAEPDADALDRCAVPGNSVLRGAADDLASAQRRPSGERETHPPSDAADGPDADLSETQHQQGCEGTQDLPLFAARAARDPAQPSLGG